MTSALSGMSGLMQFSNPAFSYADLVKTIQTASLIRYWPLWESSGNAINQVGAGNITLSNVTLGAGGIGDLRTAAAFNGSTSVGDGNTSSFSAAFSGSSGTIAFWMSVDEAVWTDATVRRAIIIQADSNNRVYLMRDSGHDQFDFITTFGGTTKQVLSTAVSASRAGWIHVALTWNKAQDRVRAYFNGVQNGTDQTGLGTFAGTVSQVTIGAGNGTPIQQWKGRLAHMGIWTVELTASEISSLANGVGHYNIVFEGDSRSAGTGASNLVFSYPRTAVRKFQTLPWRVGNIATSGETVQTMVGQVSTQLNPLFDPTAAKNIAVMLGGVNDGGTQNAATIVGYIQSWHTAARAAGWQTYVCTELDAQDAARNANNWHTTQWPAINTALRAAYTSAELIDFGADSRLQDATNTTYFNADKVHLVDAGHLALGEIAAAKLAATLPGMI